MHRKTELRGEVLSIHEPPFSVDTVTGRVVGELADVIRAVTHVTALYIGGKVICLSTGTEYRPFTIGGVLSEDPMSQTYDKPVALKPAKCPLIPKRRCSECPLGS